MNSKQRQPNFGVRWGGMGTATSSTINVGTLVLDMYDPATKQLVWAGHATGSAKQLALGGAARAMASPPRTRSFLRLRLGGGHVEPAGSGQVLAAEPPAEIWPRLISAL